MGSCLNSPYDEHHSEIQKNLDRNNDMDVDVKKLLLLGCGSSGKSTVFKQLRRVYGTGFDQIELEETRHVIRQNVVSAMMILLKKSQQLFELDKLKYQECFLNLNEVEVQEAVICVVRHASDHFHEETLPPRAVLKRLGVALGLLWDRRAIRATYGLRGYHYSLPDNMDFFLNKSEIVFSDAFAPTHIEALKTRVRTTGLIEVTYEIKEHLFNIYDVGGQRGERKKWIHSFEHVTAVIYVAALNHYNAVLFEDETKNAMHESLQLFDEICNSKWFRQTEMILFLNKDDLFREKLRELHKLSTCFSTDAGWSGEQWDGPDYHMLEDMDKDREYFDYCYQRALLFIQERYVEKNLNPGKIVFSHTTQATNKDNIKQVFWDVQNIIIRSNLKRGGFMN